VNPRPDREAERVEPNPITTRPGADRVARPSNGRPSREQPGQYDVAIVGYGPVGQLLANLLGDRGYRVAVVERHASVYALPRVAHFDHEIARILQSLGIRPDTSPYIEPYDDWYHLRNAQGEVLTRLDWSGRGPSWWNTANFFTQQELERDLDARARSHANVCIFTNHTATHLDQDSSGVTLTAQQIDKTEAAPRHDQVTITARYLVGCDGANSTIRQLAGLEQVDLGFYYDWLILDMIPDETVTYDSTAWQSCDPRRPTTLVPAGPGRRRWEFMALPGEDMRALNSTQTAWRLLQPWGLSPDNSILERHTVYTFQAKWAPEWRSDRVLLAGDSAHLMPPFLGQGMCSGLRDAHTLAWKLDLVLNGVADETLLSTYGSERLPHVQHLINHSVELGRLICVTDPDEAAARDEQLKAAAADPTATAPPPPRLGPGVILKNNPAAGLLSIQAQVTCGGDTGLFDDLVGRGWLVLTTADQLPDFPPAILELTTALDLRVLRVGNEDRDDVDVIDLDGHYATWFEQLGVNTVVVRPDFYVYAAVDVTELVPALSELERQLDLTGP